MPEEHEQLLRHLARCDVCQSVVAQFASAPATLRVVPSARKPAVRLALVAAILLLTATVALWSLRDRQASRGVDPELRFLAVAGELARTEPLLQGFQPIARAERLAPPTRVERGGSFALLAPIGRVLEARPTFRWEDPHGIPHWQLTLLRPNGEVVWTESCAVPSCAWPANAASLAEGTRWLWEVKGDGPLGIEQAQGAFTVVTAAERVAFASATQSISERAPRVLYATLAAQLAVRERLFGAADTLLRERLEQEPADVLARETLFFVLRQLGAHEADTLGIATTTSGR